jgi:hypothetical protein
MIGLCALFGSGIGGYVPVLWGGSSFSLASLLCGALGGIVGVWAGLRLSSV